MQRSMRKTKKIFFEKKLKFQVMITKATQNLDKKHPCTGISFNEKLDYKKPSAKTKLLKPGKLLLFRSILVRDFSKFVSNMILVFA